MDIQYFYANFDSIYGSLPLNKKQTFEDFNFVKHSNNLCTVNIKLDFVEFNTYLTTGNENSLELYETAKALDKIFSKYFLDKVSNTNLYGEKLQDIKKKRKIMFNSRPEVKATKLKFSMPAITSLHGGKRFQSRNGAFIEMFDSFQFSGDCSGNFNIDFYNRNFFWEIDNFCIAKNVKENGDFDLFSNDVKKGSYNIFKEEDLFYLKMKNYF